MKRAGFLLAASLVLGACSDPEETLGGPRLVADEWPLAVEFPEGPKPAYERVVLVTIDTLRADHVSGLGYPRATMPFLDSLAAQGVTFTRAMSTVSHTAPSHSSMLTGLPPLVHGVLHNGYAMDAHAVDLARIFAAAGYETAAIVNTEFLAGVAASFQTVHPTTERGDDVLRLARAWLADERRSERFFLWVHLFDPHRWKDLAVEKKADKLWPGKSPKDFERKILELHGLDRAGVEALLGQKWETVHQKTVELESLAHYLRFVDAYDSLIRYSDQMLSGLHESVEALALPGSTLWVVTADHGEGLASHGTDGHGAHIYQEQLHVPLVLHASGAGLAPRTIDALVTHLDLLPTLVEALGGRVKAPEGLALGRSLWPLVRGEPVDWNARTVFAQRKPTSEALYSLQSSRHKLLDAENSPDEFYDLDADPRELDNAFESAAEERARLERELAELLRRLEPFQRDGEQEIPDEWLDELQDLGYIR
jgi:arylsulfatase A-like enzyme